MTTSMELSRSDEETGELSAPKDVKIINLPEGKTKAEVLKQFNNWFNDCKTKRYSFERQWYLNLAFYFGRQWVQWQNGKYNELSRLVEPPRPPWRVRLTINKIKPLIRGEMAKINQEEPTFFVIPKSTEEEDILAARAGERVHEHLYRTLNLPKEKRKVSFWALVCGVGFMKDWYEEEEYDEQDTKGTIHAEAISPFHIFVPMLEEEEVERQPYIIHSSAKDPSWIEENFDLKLEPDSASTGGAIEDKFLSALGIKNNKKSMVAVKEIWIKPCADYPKGAVCMWAGNDILYFLNEWPYDHGEYPFSKLDHIPTGRFYAESVITDLIPLQREYNRTRSQIIEAKNRMSKPQLMAPKGSIDPDKITTEPGLVVFYTPGFNPPQPIPLQNIPSYVLQEIDRIQSDMNDISAQHEVSKGQAPPGVEAATAISFLQEQDDTKLAHTVSSLEEMMEKLGRHLLSHVLQNWTAERVVNIVGTNNLWEAHKLTSKDLGGNHNVRVQRGSATPSSRAAKRAFFTELANQGHISSNEMLRYLNIGETDKMYEEFQINTRHAQRENIQMSETGKLIIVNSYDDHIAHIMVHDNFRKTQEFSKLPQEAKAIFEQHSILHHQSLAVDLNVPINALGRLPTEVLLQLKQMVGGNEPTRQ